MRKLLALAVLIFTSTGLLADVELPTEVKGTAGNLIFIVPTKVDGGDVKYKLGPGLTDVTEDLEKVFGVKAKGRIIKADKDGAYEIWAWNAKANVASDLSVCKVTVGTPVPPTPVPPGPTPPGPVPPGPTPTPSPIPLAGLRVLIVYDPLTKTALPKEQQSILTSVPLRVYLRSKCAPDRMAEQDGKAYRIWESTTVANNPGLEQWKAAMGRPRASLPWIVISNYPNGGYEGPLPANPDKTIELIKKYAEAPPQTNSKKPATSKDVLPKPELVEVEEVQP